MNEYLEILNRWERQTGEHFVYENLYALLPKWQFRRKDPGSAKDRWVSSLKIDLSVPKVPNREKTVVRRMDMMMREQGDWKNGVRVMEILAKDMGLDNQYQVFSVLSDKYGLDMPRPESQSVRYEKKRKERRKDLLETMRDYFSWCLSVASSQKAQQVRAYLREQRGFTDGQIEALQFGFVPKWSAVENYLITKKKFTKQEIDAACRVHDDLGRTSVGGTHVLAIPYVCSGTLKGFLFRRIDGSGYPKYMANHSLERNLDFFNYPEEGSAVIAVVEGEMDALTATAAGIPGVVAIGGSEISGDRKNQIAKALTLGTKKIILCLDLDLKKSEEGEVPNYEKRLKAVMRTVHTIHEVDFNFDDIYVLSFPYATDPDEYIRANGKEAFLNLLRESKPWWKFIAEEKERR